MSRRQPSGAQTQSAPLAEEAKERKAIGSRIRQARLEAGFKSSARFGEAIGVRYQQVLKYEKGKDWANSYMLKRISRATGKSLGFLLGEDQLLWSETPLSVREMGPPYEPEQKADPRIEQFAERIQGLELSERDRAFRLLEIFFEQAEDKPAAGSGGKGREKRSG